MTAVANQWGVWRTGAWGNNDFRGSAGQAVTSQRTNNGWGGYGYEMRADRPVDANGEGWDWSYPSTWLEDGGLYSNTVTAITITVEIVAATLTYAAQAITVNAKTVTAVTAATLTYAGQVVTVKTVFGVIAATIALTGQAITVNARTAIAVTAGAISYAAQAVAVNAMTLVSVTAGVMNYLTRVIDVTVSGGAGLIKAGMLRLGLGNR